MRSNDENTLDITPLTQAVKAYKNIVTYVNGVESKHDDELEFYQLEAVKSALIQHFEFSYELCWKFMKRYLAREGEDAELFSRKDIFRASISMHLITDFDLWVKFHNARNSTLHTYNEEKAEEVFEVAKMFFREFTEFVKALEARI